MSTSARILHKCRLRAKSLRRPCILRVYTLRLSTTRSGWNSQSQRDIVELSRRWDTVGFRRSRGRKCAVNVDSGGDYALQGALFRSKLAVTYVFPALKRQASSTDRFVEGSGVSRPNLRIRNLISYGRFFHPPSGSFTRMFEDPRARITEAAVWYADQLPLTFNLRSLSESKIAGPAQWGTHCLGSTVPHISILCRGGRGVARGKRWNGT